MIRKGAGTRDGMGGKGIEGQWKLEKEPRMRYGRKKRRNMQRVEMTNR